MAKNIEVSPGVSVCAIGASAGGVQPLRAFFRHVPDDLGLAYVVIVHLSPDHPSVLCDILASVTQMSVAQVCDSAELKPNCVYVIAPDRELVIEGERVTARPFADPPGQRAPIDMFFRSVASARGDGIAIILSGAGSDGVLGVQAIREAGGVILVQEPAEAEFPMMPRSALASGVVDICAPIPHLVERLVEVMRSKNSLQSVPDEVAHQQVQRIIGFLHARTGHDFASCDGDSVMRRVVRRMQVTRRSGLSVYADYLMKNPEEAQELFKDLLISVTRFFRDKGAYEVLARDCIGPLFDKADSSGIRAWVVGCATGEEAYSLAILMLEEAERRNVKIPIQIFASVLDEGALATAREGRYPLSIEADVEQARLHRFFTKEGMHYRIGSEARDVVLFARHSVLKDPPFMRLNLISCRNLLIYMERQLQREVCALFAYGLKPDGFLFLGSAETADASPDLFIPVEREARLYRARSLGLEKSAVVARMPEGHRPPVFEAPRHRKETCREGSDGVVPIDALDHAAPPSILVDRNFRVLHLSPNVACFLRPSVDVVRHGIEDIVLPELRLDLRDAIRRAFEEGEPTLTIPVVVNIDGKCRRVVMQAAPVLEKGDSAPSRALVTILDGGAIADREALSPQGSNDENKHLRDTLDAAELRVSATRLEHETTIQDLRVANEELQSINEAYRTTSEELEMYKEELQSMNEELRTMNAALEIKLESIASAHGDLKNIVAATDIATLFLDHKLRIRMFTPRVANLFNITGADVGRAITDFTHRLDEDGIAQDVERVLHDLAPVERELATRDGRWLVMRARPYRTMDERINGAVITFVDITTQRETSERLRESDEQKSFLLNLSDALRRLCDVDKIKSKASEMIAAQLGLDCVCIVEFDAIADVALLQGGYARADKTPPSGTRGLAEFGWTTEAFQKGEGVAVPDMRKLPHLPGACHAPLSDLGVVACMAVALYRNGQSVGALMVGCTGQRDWTPCELEFLRTVADRLGAMIDSVVTESALRDSEKRFRALIQASSDVLYRMTPDWSQMLELRSDGFLTETDSADSAWADRYILPEDRPRVWAHIAEVIRMKVPFELEHRVQQADGTIGWTFSRAIPIFDAQNEISEWFGAAGDITERRRGEERLRETRDALRLATEASQLGWGAWDFASGEADWDARARQIIGLAEDENTIEAWMKRVHPADRPRIKAEVSASLRDHRPFDLEYRVIHPDKTERSVHGTGYFQAPKSGGAAHGTGLVRDVTEFRRWEESQRLLIGELNHRVKNMLAVIQSIARQTQRSTSGVDAFIEAFGNRVRALAAAHDILTQRRWSGAALEDIVHAAVASFSVEGDQIDIGGPQIRLGPDATISFAMACHELATNALKHGALSVPEGRVKIYWNINEAGRVVVEWTESGGPIVLPPKRKGFGSRLLEQGIARELDGVAQAEYRKEGFYWRMEFGVDDSV